MTNGFLDSRALGCDCSRPAEKCFEQSEGQSLPQRWHYNNAGGRFKVGNVVFLLHDVYAIREPVVQSEFLENGPFIAAAP